MHRIITKALRGKILIWGITMKKGIFLTVLFVLCLGQAYATANCYQFEKLEVNKTLTLCITSNPNNSPKSKAEINQCIENNLSQLVHQGNHVAEVALLGFYKDQNNPMKVAEWKQKIEEHQSKVGYNALKNCLHTHF